MKRRSMSLIITGIQIITMMSHHYTPFGIAVINKLTNNKCWRVCRGKGTLMHSWWEHRLMQSLWKTVWKYLQKVKIELLYDPVISFLEIYPKNIKQ